MIYTEKSTRVYWNVFAKKCKQVPQRCHDHQKKTLSITEPRNISLTKRKKKKGRRFQAKPHQKRVVCILRFRDHQRNCYGQFIPRSTKPNYQLQATPLYLRAKLDTDRCQQKQKVCQIFQHQTKKKEKRNQVKACEHFKSPSRWEYRTINHDQTK